MEVVKITKYSATYSIERFNDDKRHPIILMLDVTCYNSVQVYIMVREVKISLLSEWDQNSILLKKKKKQNSMINKGQNNMFNKVLIIHPAS